MIFIPYKFAVPVLTINIKIYGEEMVLGNEVLVHKPVRTVTIKSEIFYI